MSKLNKMNKIRADVEKVLANVEGVPAEGFDKWLNDNWDNLNDTSDEDKYMLYLWNSNKRRLVAQTAINMAKVIMGEDFQKWLYDNWDEVEKRYEFFDIMEYYIRGDW